MSEDLKTQLQRVKECQALIAEAIVRATTTQNELNRIWSEIQTKWNLMSDWVSQNVPHPCFGSYQERCEEYSCPFKADCKKSTEENSKRMVEK